MKKLTNKKGFTLMEMIIVVAIIAILAVITIPTLTGNTAKAEKAADAANLRAAKAVYQVLAMEGKTPKAGDVYDVATSTFITKAADKITDADKCGQCTGDNGHKGAHIVATDNGVKWSAGNETTCP